MSSFSHAVRCDVMPRAAGEAAPRSGRSGLDRHHRFADGGAEVGADGAAAAGRERAGRARVLSEVFRRPRISAVLRALGRERRPGRRVRELQSLARAARAGCERRDRSDVHEGQRRDDQAVHRGEDDEARAGRRRRDVLQGVQRAVRLAAPRRRAAALQPHGALGAGRSEISRARAPVLRASTWAKIPTRRTTIPSTTSSAA